MNILLTEASTYWIQRLDYVNKASLIIFLISIFWWIILIIHHYIDGRDIEDLKMYKKLFLFLGVVTLMSLLILIFVPTSKEYKEIKGIDTQNKKETENKK